MYEALALLWQKAVLQQQEIKLYLWVVPTFSKISKICDICV